MMFLLRLKTLLRDLLLPPAGLLILGFFGLWLWSRRPQLARACIALSLGGLWLLSMPIVADTLTRLTEPYPALDWTQVAGTQAIVILGGGEHRNWAPEYGGPSADAVLLDRLAYGVYVSRRTGLPILVTGFHTEAIAMRDSLRRTFGVEARWVDAESYDTFQNAHHAMQLLRADGVHRVILITSGTHIRRSLHEFTAAGADVVPAPVGMIGSNEVRLDSFFPHPDALLHSYIAVYELVGESVRWFLATTHLRHQ
jgi:uncharacterized SAM-binding protein YcdF (DUF218 family)